MVKKFKPTQTQVNNYINLLHQSSSSLGILKALRRQGFDDFEINRYLKKEGKTHEQSIALIRKLNETE